MLVTKSAPPADTINPVFEMTAEHYVFGEASLIRPYGSKTPYQRGNPVSRLYSLISMAFEVEQRLNEMSPPIRSSVHAS